jgi:hypothetical protein
VISEGLGAVFKTEVDPVAEAVGASPPTGSPASDRVGPAPVRPGGPDGPLTPGRSGPGSMGSRRIARARLRVEPRRFGRVRADPRFELGRPWSRLAPAGLVGGSTGGWVLRMGWGGAGPPPGPVH